MFIGILELLPDSHIFCMTTHSFERLCQREQSQACLSYAERSQSYAKILLLKNIYFPKGSHASIRFFIREKSIHSFT